jgi:hypothetical protein
LREEFRERKVQMRKIKKIKTEKNERINKEIKRPI